MGSKDYYAILGVNRLANDDEIKRAYKQKALKHHPDKNHGDVDAEKKFMDISEAYEILSDPHKRSLYDRFGSEELRNYLGADPRSYFSSSSANSDFTNDEYTYDPYNNYFVRFKDPSTFHDLYVTLEEVNKGATKKIKVTRQRYNAELSKAVRDEKILEIQIKPGWKEGTKITFEGEGDEGDQNTIPGDIVFIIRDKPHAVFERSNSDLIYRVKLTLKQALLGTTISIPFLDSNKAPYQFRSSQEIITPQTEKRFLNEGLPYPKDPTQRGDLIVKFDILFPKALNQEQRTIVDCCFSNSIDFYQPTDSIYHNCVLEAPPPTQQQKPTTPQPQPSPSQKPTIPNLNVTSGTKPQTSSNSTINNTQQNLNHHPHHPHHPNNVNSNGHPKSSQSPTKTRNKNRLSTIDTSASASAPISQSN